MSGKGNGGCSLSHDWRAGRLEAGMHEGHPELREALQREIPAANLVYREGNCPQPT